MSANTSRRSVVRRLLASWYAPAAVALLLLLALGAWVMPTPIERTVTDAATGQARTVRAWDTSNWQAVSAHWWQALLLGLGLALVLWGAWGGRGWASSRASVVRFFAASLLFHCLLVLSLGAVPLARAVVEHAEVIRVNQAAELFDDPRPAQGGGRAAYEKVADLPPDDTIKPSVIRQPAAQPRLAEDEALAPTLPLHAVRGLPPERLMFVPPRQPEVERQPLEIQRQGSSRVLRPVEIQLETPPLPPPEALPREKPIEERRVAVPRREAAAPDPGASARPLALPELKRPGPADVRVAAADQPRLREGEPLPPALAGRRRPGRMAPAAPPEASPQLKAEAVPTESPPGAGRVTLPRLAAASPPGGPHDEPAVPRLPLRRSPRVALPTPAPLDVPPAFTPPADRLPRATARADRTARIEERLAAPAPLVLRQKEERQRSVKQFGGTAASEAAVERGLDWLAAHQNSNGSWGLDQFHVNCKHPRCADPGSVHSDPAGTGIALLPFLGAGNTPTTGKHRLTVARALHWLVSRQQADGTWPAPADARPMYGHAMASIALCEAYGMTQDAKLRQPAQKALDYIVKAQHAATGGWRYRPNMPGDTSVLGWQVMALKSGEMAGLTVPAKAFEGVKRWLARVEGNRPVGGRFGYQSANPTPAMTAQGLLCLQYLGARRDDPRMRAGTDYLLGHLPRAGAETSYYWYHATQVMYHMQGKHWKAWNDRMRDLLVTTQELRGPLAGSWKPVDAREKPGGRVYATALRLLMLEVYYRHLPLYQQLQK